MKNGGSIKHPSAYIYIYLSLYLFLSFCFFCLSLSLSISLFLSLSLSLSISLFFSLFLISLSLSLCSFFFSLSLSLFLSLSLSFSLLVVARLSLSLSPELGEGKEGGMPNRGFPFLFGDNFRSCPGPFWEYVCRSSYQACGRRCRTKEKGMCKEVVRSYWEEKPQTPSVPGNSP